MMPEEETRERAWLYLTPLAGFLSRAQLLTQIRFFLDV